LVAGILFTSRDMSIDAHRGGEGGGGGHLMYHLKRLQKIWIIKIQ